MLLLLIMSKMKSSIKIHNNNIKLTTIIYNLNCNMIIFLTLVLNVFISLNLVNCANFNETIVTMKHHQHTIVKRNYKSKYTIEELLNTKFDTKLSDDIDMDPCKAGGFMGDIALPDIKYESSEWKTNSRFNKTFQQELEILKQEVYNEGLQVEEEGLTDIIRKKTKIPSNNNNEDSNERNRNDPVLSMNEPLKGIISGQGTNLKNGIIGQQKETIYPRISNFESKLTIPDKIQPSLSLSSSSSSSSSLSSSSILPSSASSLSYSSLLHNTNTYQDLTNTTTTTTTAATATTKTIITAQVPEEKLNKSSVSPLRNVDHRKIQSNTKDIEDDSGNNFVSERKIIILPTSPPTQRSTLPNVYSNAGGNGGVLDDVEILHADGIVRRRHKRRRQRRRSSISNDYRRKLDRLKDELNRPVVTTDDRLLKRKLKSINRNKSSSSSLSMKSTIHHKNGRNKKKQLMKNLKSKKISKKNITNDKISEMTGINLNTNTMPNQYTHRSINSQNQIENQSQKDAVSEKHHHRSIRAVTAKKERVWDYGVIPYEIDGNFSGSHKALFKQAMRHWENFTCIKFVERDPQTHPNYIIFTIRNCGCCSFVGKRGNGGQAISIGRNCDKFGIVVHELGHVVGFWHEHTRPDREKHVIIELSNIMKGQDYNFNMLTSDDVDSLGMPYDYDSIMHYARNTFSKGTYLDTILPIEVKGKKRPDIGQRVRLSAGDIAQANLLYKCPKCGRTFQENTGAFSSPSYFATGLANVNETERCEWRITATHGERIVLHLENLNLFKSEKCQTDYLEIRDGYWFKSPLIARYCGKVISETITTVSSRMLLTYVNTHRYSGYRGFKAEFEAICGGELSVETDGRLESPNYPLEYLPNKECIWKISVPDGFQVALKFQSFEVENHDNCVYDYVEVRDGNSHESRLIGVFCGYKPPPNMKSSSNTMFVKFVSDGSVQKAGFSAIFMKEVDECETQNHGCQHECINTLGGYECSCYIGYELHSDKKSCEDACGGVIEATNGTITSPSFPDIYPVLKECIWEIIALPNFKISLNFTHFDLEGTTHEQSDCGYDSVSIYSKLGENRLKRIGTYCGSKIPPVATSEGNALRIEFHSDKSVQKSGFAAVFFTDIDECATDNGGCMHDCRNTIGSYICSCNNGYTLHENGHDCKEGECKFEITAPTGVIYSPNYPGLYPANADCVWHFTTTPGHRIKLIFNEFEIESHQECAYDHVVIYDGDSEDSDTLGKFCGDKLPYPISASSNEMYMVLKTDKNKQRRGFSAFHSTACGGYLKATNQIQQFYSHAKYANQDYSPNMNCDWTIKSETGSNVQLFFLEFEIEDHENCSYDYVEVYAGMEDASGPLYGRYCGNKNPPDIISLTDSLLVRFQTDDSMSKKGFTASYVAVDPFEISEEINSDSSEMITPFPGYLKSIYKTDSDEYNEYGDYSENTLSLTSRRRKNHPYHYNHNYHHNNINIRL